MAAYGSRMEIFMTERHGIAVAGSILVDKINTVESYPEAGRLVKILDVKNSVGGLVPNVGIDLRAISPELPVSAYGRVGCDDDGSFVTAEMARYGIDTSEIVRSEKRHTSFTSVMSVPSAERTFFTYPGASADFGYDDIDFEKLDKKMLHLGYFLLLDKIDAGDGERILKKLSEIGVITSADLVSENSDRYKKVLPALKYIDNFIVNELEASGLTGISDTERLLDMCRALKSHGVRGKVIIHKRDCGVCFDGEHFVKVPSVEIPKELLRGKTGAGDAYTAGCLTALHDGVPTEEMLDFAARCATVSLMSENAVDAMRTKEEIYKITKDYKRAF